jgi:hypothetical protein
VNNAYRYSYTACGEIMNSGPGRLVYTLEMTVFGPSGEPHNTHLRTDPGPQAMGEGGWRGGCGFIFVVDDNVRHPWGARYELRLKGQFDDATAGSVAAQSTIRPLVETVSQPLGVVISEIRAYGPRGEGDEFVELQNVSSQPVSLDGWRLVSSNGLRPGVDPYGLSIFLPATTLGPGCRYLVTNGLGGGFGYSGSVRGDLTYTFGEVNANAGIALTDRSFRATDQVGMSYDTQWREGTPLAPLERNLSYQRVGPDTDDNARDFVRSASDPQNSSTCR